MFKNNRFSLLFSAAICLVLIGCGNEPKGRFSDAELANIPNPGTEELPSPSGGLVLAVNSETISAEEIIEAGIAATKDTSKQVSFEKFAQQVYPSVLQLIRDKITNILLYKKAKATVPDSVFEEGGQLEKAVDAEIRKYLASYENNYSLAQKNLKDRGFDWKSYREFQKRQLLAQMYFGKQIERNPDIPYSEIVEYYEKNKQEQFTQEPNLEFLLIDIRKGDNPNSAMQKAKEAIGELEKGEEFQKCVEKYSEGIKAKRGGLWQTSEPSSLVEPYNEVVKVLKTMKEGQISAIIKTKEHLFIAKLLEYKEAGFIPLKDIQQGVERELKDQKRRQQMNELLKKLFKEADLAGIDSFAQYCLRQIYLTGRES